MIRIRIVANLAGIFRQYPEWTGAWFGSNPLAGPAPEKNRNWSPEGMQAVADGLAHGLLDRDREVRAAAIAGLAQVGPDAAALLAAALTKESDPRNQEALAGALVEIGDPASLPALAAVATGRAGRCYEPVLAATAVAGARGNPRTRRCCGPSLGLVYNAQTLPTLGEARRAAGADSPPWALPANDLASFLENPAAPVRVSALLSLNVRRPLPEEVRRSVRDRLRDPSAEVRDAAILATVACRMTEATPELRWRSVGRSQGAQSGPGGRRLLPSARPAGPQLYLEAIRGDDPALRRAAGWAIAAIRDQAGDRLATAATTGDFSGPSAAALERAMAQFVPITQWRVIAAFPRRTMPQVFFGERTIDFARTQAGQPGGVPSPGRYDRPSLSPVGSASMIWKPRRAAGAVGYDARQLGRSRRLRRCRARLRPRRPRPLAARLERDADRDGQRAACVQ